MTPPPFSFELIVTGLCLITIQGPPGMETGAKFNFLDAGAGKTVCGEYFDDAHVPSLTFDLANLGEGSTADYTQHRLPDGRYVGELPLSGVNLCIHPYPEKDSGNVPFDFAVLHKRTNEQRPTASVSGEDFGWIASLKDLDTRAKGVYQAVAFAGQISTSFGELKSSELATESDGTTPIVWKVEGPKVPQNPGPDFPKALAGAAVVRFDQVVDRVELEDCVTHDPLLIFRPGPEVAATKDPLVQVVAANLPRHSALGGHVHPMAHFLWYYSLLDWTSNGPGKCPEDSALPVDSSAAPGGIGAITGSSVFCPPATP